MNTNVLFVILIAAIFALFFLLASSLKKTSSQIQELKQSQSENKAMELMQQQIGQLTKNINLQLQSMSGQFLETTGQIGQTLGNVKKDLGKVESVTLQVLEKAKNISDLENLLKAPKFRGGMGEFFLGDLLAQILPPAHYNLQYRFKSGEVVDAIVKIGNNIVPIDAKFPLENFKKHLSEENPKEKNDLKKKFIADVKKHIDTISQKYILPDEGTYNFALMYIPAENIYYETILKEETTGEDRSIFSWATQKRVIPVSPNSFFAYLQVIVLGLKGLQIEKSAQSIFQSLTRLQGDLSRFGQNFKIMGTHLTNAKTKYDEAEKRLEKFTDRLEQIGSHSMEQLPSAGNKENSQD